MRVGRERPDLDVAAHVGVPLCHRPDDVTDGGDEVVDPRRRDRFEPPERRCRAAAERDCRPVENLARGADFAEPRRAVGVARRDGGVDAGVLRLPRGDPRHALDVRPLLDLELPGPERGPEPVLELVERAPVADGADPDRSEVEDPPALLRPDGAVFGHAGVPGDGDAGLRFECNHQPHYSGLTSRAAVTPWLATAGGRRSRR